MLGEREPSRGRQGSLLPTRTFICVFVNQLRLRGFSMPGWRQEALQVLPRVMFPQLLLGPPTVEDLVPREYGAPAGQEECPALLCSQHALDLPTAPSHRDAIHFLQEARGCHNPTRSLEIVSSGQCRVFLNNPYSLTHPFILQVHGTPTVCQALGRVMRGNPLSGVYPHVKTCRVAFLW